MAEARAPHGIRKVLSHRAHEPRRPQLDALVRGASSEKSKRDRIRTWVEQREGKANVLRAGAAPLDNVEAPLVQDALRIAEQVDRPVEDVVDTVDEQQDLIELDARLATSYPDSYAGMVMSTTDEPAQVVFDDSVPAQALDEVAPASADVDVSAGDALPQEDVQGWLDRIQGSLRPVVGLAQVSFESETQKFRIVVREDAAASDAEMEVAIGTLPEGASLAPIERTLTDHEDDAYEDHTIRGGGTLVASGCTAGFVVRHRVTGEKFLSTAGHCPVLSGASQDVYQARGVDDWTRTTGMYYGNRVYFGLITPDFSYLSIPETRDPYPSTYITYTDKREVGAYYRHRLPKGTWVCHFGRTTEHSCSTIDEPSINLGHYGGSGLVAVSTNVSAPGDSGGPWWRSASAVGVHSGKVSNRDNRSVYSPVHMMAEFGNFQPWTTN